MFRSTIKKICAYRKAKTQRREKRSALKHQKSVCKQCGQCGTEFEVFGKISICFPQNLSIGDRCKMNEGTYINARSGVTIGNDVTLSPYSKIISTEYDIPLWLETGQRIHRTDTPVVIGNHCWICAGAIVLPGVRITGEYVIVAAGAVVTHDFTDHRIVIAGSPAKIIKYL